MNQKRNSEIKTFRGDNFNEAMAKAEMKLGENMKVVETREVTEGGIFGFFGEKRIEVDAFIPVSSNGNKQASSSRETSQQYLQKQIEQLSKNIRSDRKNTGSKKSNQQAQNQTAEANEWNIDEPAMPDFSARDRARKIIQEKSNEFDGTGSDDAQTYKKPAPTPNTIGLNENGTNNNSPMKRSIGDSKEKRQITRLAEKTDLLAEKVDDLIETSTASGDMDPGSDSEFPGELNDIFNRLVAQDMEKRFARDLVGRVRKQLEAEEFHDLDSIYKELSTVIQEEFEEPPALLQDEDQPLLVPFIGPTGVGKTTTIAKLAAYYDVEENRNVGFITLDGYRLAAVEQLRRYADILRVPLRDVTETENVSNAIDELIEQDVEMIFIDTAGRSQFDEERIQDLVDLFPQELPSKTHLVLSATSRSRDIKEILAGFDEIGFDRVAMTKLDETRSYGTVYNVMKRTDIPMAYLTDGQEVPDDLWIAEADQIANLIIEGAEG